MRKGTLRLQSVFLGEPAPLGDGCSPKGTRAAVLCSGVRESGRAVGCYANASRLLSKKSSNGSLHS